MIDGFAVEIRRRQGMHNGFDGIGRYVLAPRTGADKGGCLEPGEPIFVHALIPTRAHQYD